MTGENGALSSVHVITDASNGVGFHSWMIGIYKWYISGIYCQLGDYMPPTTFYGNQYHLGSCLDSDSGS